MTVLVPVGAAVVVVLRLKKKQTMSRRGVKRKADQTK
jgi:hypothetical protein